MSVTAAEVKALRERTGAGMMDCKKTLVETEGDVDAAIKLLRQKGLAAAAKKASREAKEGRVESYIHAGGKIGVLLELNCETDFVARTDEFQALARDLAMQVAAMSPEYVAPEDVPEEVVAREKEVLLAQAKAEGKPENIAEKMVEGRLRKFYDNVCLLRQTFIKDEAGKQTIEDVLKNAIATMGENLVIARFARFQVGG